jgi:hypothetical protein
MVLKNNIEGDAYNCQSEFFNVSLKKLTLDSAKKLNNATPLRLQQLQKDYDISKKKYDESCLDKEDDGTADCIALQARITSLQSTITYLYSVRDNEGADLRTTQLQDMVKNFNDTKCGEKVGGYRAGVVRSISETFQALDKTRIEEQSKYQAKQKIFFGGIVLIGAVLIVTMFGKKD